MKEARTMIGTKQPYSSKTGNMMFPKRAPIRPVIMIKLTAIVLQIKTEVTPRISILLEIVLLHKSFFKDSNILCISEKVHIDPFVFYDWMSILI